MRLRLDCLASSRALPKELLGVGFKDLRQLFEHVDRRGVLLAFEHANVVAIDARTIGKLLLRQTFGVPQSSQVYGDDFPQAHAV